MTIKVVSRADWGARPRRSHRHLSGSRGFAVHWAGSRTGLHGGVDHDRCIAEIQGQQRYHMNRPDDDPPGRGWSDWAYNFGVCPHAIFIGRNWGIRSAAQGTTWGNDNYHAVQVMLGVGDSPPTDFQLRAVLWLRDKHRRRYGRAELRPHRWFKSTQCPGDDLARWINRGAPAPQGDTMPSADDIAYATWARTLSKPWDWDGEWHAATFLRYAFGNAKQANEQASKNADKLDALLAAHEGLDTTAILERIDAHHADVQTLLETLRGLIDEHQSGALDADAVVARIGELLSAAADGS